MSLSALHEPIATELRRAILRGELVPGQVVKERERAAKMGVSRTPMREAIRILAKEGLVELRPSRSPVVAMPDPGEIEGEAEVMLALERLSGQLVCRHASAEDLQRIAAIAGRFEDEFDTAERIDSFETDMAFHAAIAEASGNASLARTHRACLARLWHARYLASRRRANRSLAPEHHRAILAALLARDEAAFAMAVDVHLGHIPRDLRDVVAAERDQDRTADAAGKDGDETSEVRRGRIGEAGSAG